MLNQCNFIGRLGADPDSKFAQSGTQIVNINLACSEKYKGEETTEWVRVVAFGKLAEIMGQYLQKGSLCFISGKMQTRRWQDQEGKDRYSTEIIAREMRMLSSKGEGCGSAPPEPPGGGNQHSMGGDCPF